MAEHNIVEIASPDEYYRAVESLTCTSVNTLAGHVADIHTMVAYSRDINVCDSASHIYQASQGNLLAACRMAWPRLNAQAIYEAWIDGGCESIYDAAEWVLRNPLPGEYRA